MHHNAAHPLHPSAMVGIGGGVQEELGGHTPLLFDQAAAAALQMQSSTNDLSIFYFGPAPTEEQPQNCRAGNFSWHGPIIKNMTSPNHRLSESTTRKLRPNPERWVQPIGLPECSMMFLKAWPQFSHSYSSFSHIDHQSMSFPNVLPAAGAVRCGFSPSAHRSAPEKGPGRG